MKSLESLAFFVRSCPIIIETSDKLKPPVIGLGRDYVYVADFDNGEPDENIVRKALWYVSRERSSVIGINDAALTKEDKQKLGTIVSSGDRPYPFKRYSYRNGFVFPLRVKPDNPVYFHPYDDIEVYRGKLGKHRYFCEEFDEYVEENQQYDPTLKKIFENWLSQKSVPQDVNELFIDPFQNHERLYRMIGNKTYKVSKNKNISPEIKQIAEKIRDLRKKQLEEPIPVEDLEKVVRFLVGDLDWSRLSEPQPTMVYSTHRGEHWEQYRYVIPGPPKEEIEKAIKAIAQTAYDIRQSYPKKGWEVRHGLVHNQAYKKLERIASQNADPKIVKEIMNMHRKGRDMKISPVINDKYYSGEYVYGDFRQAMYYSRAIDRRFFIFPETEKDFEKIGRLRFFQWHEGVLPYTQEFNLMIDIMWGYLLRKRFRDEVNNWLIRHGRPEVDWMEVRGELANGKG